MSEAVEPIVLVRLGDPEAKPLLYACPKCGSCNSPRIYLAREEVAHEAARRAAVECYNCMTDRKCNDCENMVGSKHYTACAECREKKRFAKYEQISADEIDDYCFGEDGGEMFYSIEDAVDAGVKWVHPALPLRTFSIDIEQVLEHCLEDHHEDASMDDLNGVEALVAAIEAFNAAQTSGTYEADTKRVANIEHWAAEAEAAS